MDREIVTREELTEILTERLQEKGNDIGLFVDSITHLRGTDEDGCNWSCGIFRGGQGSQTEWAKQEFLEVVRGAKREFNVQP